MNIDWTYFGTLIVVALATMTTGVSPMRRTAIALFLNWLVCTSFVLNTGVYDPWLFFIVADTATAWAILYQPAGKIQGVIGGLILTQIMCHGIYGLSKFINPTTLSPDAYLQVLDILGYLQLILLGGWAGGRWACYLYPRLRRHYLRLAGPEGASGFS